MEKLMKEFGKVAIAGHYVGAIPFNWNPYKGTLEKVNSKRHRIFTNATLVFFISSILHQFLSIVIDIHSGTFKMDMTGFFRLNNTLIGTLAGIFQINSFWKKDQLRGYWNQLIGRVQTELTEGLLGPEALDKICWICRLLIIVGEIAALIINVFALIVYATQCDYNSILVVCRKSDDSMETMTGVVNGALLLRITLKIISTIFVVFIFAQNTFGILFIANILLVSVVFCHFFMRRMKVSISETDRSRFPMSEPNKWLNEYRTIQLLFARINDTMGEFMMPSFMSITVVVLVGILYTLIVMPPSELAFFVNLIVFFISVAGYIVVIVQLASFFMDQSIENLFLRQRESRRKGHLYHAAKSCIPLRINVGPFFYFTRDLTPIFFNIVIEQTVDAILM